MSWASRFFVWFVVVGLSCALVKPSAAQPPSTVESFAATLAAASNEKERDDLLTAKPELASKELVRALIRQGNRAFEQSQYPQALAVLACAQKLAERLNDRAGSAQALNSRGNVYVAQGDYPQALASLQVSLTISETLDDQQAMAGTWRNFGNVYYSQGEWKRAAEAFQRGLSISEVINDKPGIARGLGSLGVVYDVQGDYPRALASYEKALLQFEALGDKGGMARTLGNLAIVANEQENYARALEYNLRSLTLFETLGNEGGQARTLHNIAMVYFSQGSYDKALGHFRQSLALREKLGEKISIARTLEGMGSTYFEQGDLAQALELYRRSQQFYETLGDKKGIADVLGNIGSVYSERGDYAQALRLLQQSLALRESLGDVEGGAAGLANLGAVYVKQGEFASALAVLERAVVQARQIGDLAVLSQARYQAGTAHLALKQTTQAQAAFEESIAVIEGLREQVAGGAEEQRAFLENKLAAYRALLSLRIAQGETFAALTDAERMKARVLLDVLRQERLPIQKAMTESEREQERRLKSELTTLNTSLRELKQSRQPDAQRVGALQKRLEQSRFAYESFQNALYATHPELKIQRGAAPLINAVELASLLPDANSALLEYVVTKTTTYLFVITLKAQSAEAQVQCFALPLASRELQLQIETFRQQLAARELGFRVAAARLYDALLKPAQTLLKGKTRLVIVPDDKLWDLPFQALLTEAKRFLLEDAAITYAPSLTVLREMNQRRVPRAKQDAMLLALGNPALGKTVAARAALTTRGETLAPLPEAEQEVKALGQLYGASSSKVYIGAAAREDRAKAEAGQARVLHFATHGALNNHTPMYSHLVLAQDDLPQTKEDGLLEAWEVMQLDLHAELAVLSACETARGRIGAGEGMIGLTWALFVAGVPATVVSQWKVESAATRELMIAFHRQLRAPQTTKAAALRQAALSVMKRPATSHPFYWAGFILVGAGQ